MCSKNHDLTHELAQTRRSWSLVGRLTFWITLSSVGVLLMATLFLFISLGRNVAREDNEFLADKITLLRTILARYPNDLRSLQEEVEWEASTQKPTKYYARVLDDQGKILIETSDMREVLPLKIFPAPLEIAHEPEQGKRWKNDDRRVFLLVSAWSLDGSHGKHLIQVALDVTQERKTLIYYRQSMTVVLALGIFFSIGLCFFITRKGMEPLRDITTAVQRISAEQLHDRIGPAPWPHELVALAQAYDGILDRLEESFGKLSRFSADIAHELRTPINNLMGTAEVTLTRERSSQEYRQVIETSLDEYGRLARMIESLLFLARAENKGIQIEKSWIDVQKALENIRELYDALAEESRVTVVCRGEVRVFAEPMLFQMAVSNLLANALRYTPQGGRIIIQAEEQPDKSVQVSVSDTGCGIPMEHHAKIFDRFYCVDPSRSHGAYGTGLGLAIVKSIMELHKGSVSLQSEINKGTIITLSFPPAT